MRKNSNYKTQKANGNNNGTPFVFNDILKIKVYLKYTPIFFRVFENIEFKPKCIYIN